MAKLKLDIVTAEKQTFSDEVDAIIAPGIQGQLGILDGNPHVTQPAGGTLGPGGATVQAAKPLSALAVSTMFLSAFVPTGGGDHRSRLCFCGRRCRM